MDRRVDVVNLDGGFPHVWDSRFTKSTRKHIRKAERNPWLHVERGTATQLVPVFYDLYMDWTRRRAVASGLPVSLAVRMAKRREPLGKFMTLAAGIGDAWRTWVAWHDGEAVAAIITLVHGQQAVCWGRYSRHELAGPLQANRLLTKLGIEDACAEGAQYYSMGESGRVDSLMEFKRSLGATPRPSVYCRMERLPLLRLIEMRGQAERLVARAITAARSGFGRPG